MKKLLCCMALSFPSMLLAQQNRIEIGTGHYRMFGVAGQDKSPVNQVSIGLNRCLTQKISINLRYIHPNPTGLSAQSIGRTLVTQEVLDSYEDEGKLFYRHAYHYVDAGLNYTAFSASNHSITLHQNISLAMGKNDYLKNLANALDPFSDVIYSVFETRNAKYLGAVTGIRYDYLLWQGRVNLGADLCARYYVGHFPFQVNYGFHLGFNF